MILLLLILLILFDLFCVVENRRVHRNIGKFFNEYVYICLATLLSACYNLLLLLLLFLKLFALEQLFHYYLFFNVFLKVLCLVFRYTCTVSSSNSIILMVDISLLIVFLFWNFTANCRVSWHLWYSRCVAARSYKWRRLCHAHVTA